MRDLSTTLSRGIARQVLAWAPLRARLDGRPPWAASADGRAGVKLRPRRRAVHMIGYSHAPLPTLCLSADLFLCAY